MAGVGETRHPGAEALLLSPSLISLHLVRMGGCGGRGGEAGGGADFGTGRTFSSQCVSGLFSENVTDAMLWPLHVPCVQIGAL